MTGVPSWPLLALLALGCAARASGSARPLPAIAPEVGEARTSEPDGLRVLWNGATGRKDFETRSWLANRASELQARWVEAAPRAPVPAVDFTRYVVFGLSHGGRECQPEISRVSAEPSGVVRLRAEEEAVTCADLVVPVALVVAVPRRLLTASALLVAPGLDRAYQFSIPAAPGSSSVRSVAPAPSPAVEHARLEAVTLPARGHLALATLNGGGQVWVAHEVDGSIGVVSAVTSIRRWPLEGLPEYLLVPVQWRPESGRFQGGWDPQGRNVHGFAPLTPRSFHVDEAGRLWVGGGREPTAGPIRARRFAPQLDGPARPYASLVRRAWTDLQPGDLALVDLDLVSSPTTGVRLCTAAKPAEGAQRLQACPLAAPRVSGAPEHPAAPPFVLYGPFIVRRDGASAEVIVSRLPVRKAVLLE